MARVAEREVVLLHRQDVREVGRELDRQLEGERRPRVVRDRDPVLHPGADEPLPCDRELVELESARHGVPEVERGREVRDPAVRERQRPVSVDGQGKPREEPRVEGEEALARRSDVPELVGNAEVLAVEDGEGRHYVEPWRTMVSWEACWSGFTTSSSTTQLPGLVTIQRMQSATSSGVM